MQPAPLPPPPNANTPRLKLAARLASQLTTEIVDGDLAAGASLGNEIDLAGRLKASRWSVREAINILEREGQIAVRRGRYGGIFVAAPGVDNISSSLRSYLEFIRVSVEETIEARKVLDSAVVELAIARVTAADIPVLRDARNLQSDQEGIHAGFVQYEALLNVMRSPLLQSFVRAVGQLGISAIIRSTLGDEELADVMRLVRTKRREQIEAVIAAEVSDATVIEAAILDATTKLLKSAVRGSESDTPVARTRALGFLAKARKFKRPELLMHEIAADVVARGWPVGEHIGTEAELLRRYKVSRSAFREAIRSLEHIGVVEMRTGRQSGLKIGAPDPQGVINRVHRQFARIGITHQSSQDAFRYLATTCAGLAAQRCRGVDVSSWASEGEPVQFFASVADASHNRILAFLMRVITDAAGGFEIAEISRNSMSALSAAIEAGDAALARRIMFDVCARVSR